MSTQELQFDTSIATVLAAIPAGLRDPLIRAFREVMRNYRERRWEPSELNGGKLCEIIYTILRGHVDGQFGAAPSKPKNMYDACREFEKASSSFSRSVRIQIPRMIICLYEFRNNRGVGHVGGDVDANQMDAVAVVHMAKWLVAELIRLFHDVSTDHASRIVESIVDRTVPIVWEVGNRRRVLDTSLSKTDQCLLLLYSCANGASDADLCDWIEGLEPPIFRRDVLVRLHKRRLIEFDRVSSRSHLSPTGISYVEDNLLVEIALAV